jgi:exodeoxyribonuclease VII small subunit
MTKSFNFEKSINELEQLVISMEKGELTLEQSLKHFEKGIALTRKCQQALIEAEQKVSILTKSNDLDEFPQKDRNDE